MPTARSARPHAARTHRGSGRCRVAGLAARRAAGLGRRSCDAARQADRLRLLYTVTAPSAEPAEDRIRRALRLTTDLLGVDAGILSQIEGDVYTVRVAHVPSGLLTEGQRLPLADAYCAMAIAAGDAVSTGCMGRTELPHPSYAAMGIETYAGVPVRVGRGLFGSLCVYAAAERPGGFSEADLDLLRVLAVWVGGTLEQQAQQRRLAERDALVRGFFEAAPLMMGVAELVHDADGAPADVLHLSDNAATADFFGTTPEAMRDRLATRLGAPPATLARWLAAYAAAGATARPARFEAAHEHPDGPRTLAATVSQILPADPAAGRRARFCYVAEDVTEARLAEASRARSERRLHVLSEATFEGLLFLRDGRALDANAQLLKLFGFATVDEVVGRATGAFVAPEHAARVAHAAASAGTAEVLAVRACGETFWAEVQAALYPDYDADGPAHILAVRDVSARKAAEARVRFQSDVLAHVTEAVVALDLDGRVTYWNAGAEHLHGLAAADALGRPLHDLVRYHLPADDADGADAPAPVDALRRAVDRAGDLVYDGPTGRRAVSVSASVLRDEDGRERGLLAVARDVTARQALAAQLRHQALHDPLTGLPNRLALRRRLEQHLADGDRFGVLFVDLDRFKGINDTLGHDVGDRLLVAVAARMSAAVGPRDVVARLGGDEFCVVLPGDARRARRVAERLLRALETPVELAERRLVPAASIGVVRQAAAYADPDALLRDADTAMYEAKQAGRSRLAVFGPAMHRAAAARFETEQDLRDALAEGQLALRFQPIVDLATGAAVGAEALVRWQHPTRGLLSPADFVPLAEDIGLVADIDRWVLDAATRTVAGWRLPPASRFALSVNCSEALLCSAGLPELAARAAARLPGPLTLELSERALVDSPAALAAIAGLRAHGVRLTVDDFGTGYSSLGLLHRLPVGGLKVDRSFVADLEHSASARAVVRAVVRFSSDLGLRLVAEGIETDGQWALLRAAGCGLGQGFRFAEPLEADAFRDALGGTWTPPG